MLLFTELFAWGYQNHELQPTAHELLSSIAFVIKAHTAVTPTFYTSRPTFESLDWLNGLLCQYIMIHHIWTAVTQPQAARLETVNT